MCIYDSVAHLYPHLCYLGELASLQHPQQRDSKMFYLCNLISQKMVPQCNFNLYLLYSEMEYLFIYLQFLVCELIITLSHFSIGLPVFFLIDLLLENNPPGIPPVPAWPGPSEQSLYLNSKPFSVQINIPRDRYSFKGTQRCTSPETSQGNKLEIPSAPPSICLHSRCVMSRSRWKGGQMCQQPHKCRVSQLGVFLCATPLHVQGTPGLPITPQWLSMEICARCCCGCCFC